MYIKYDFDSNTILKGPQEERPDETWVRFVPAAGKKYRQVVNNAWDENEGAVVQTLGAEYSPPYMETRSHCYGRIGEQLDMLWHDIEAGTLDQSGAFYNHVKTIKDAIPKE